MKTWKLDSFYHPVLEEALVTSTKTEKRKLPALLSDRMVIESEFLVFTPFSQLPSL